MGIRQKGDPILTQPTLPFDLPGEANEAARLQDELMVYVDRLKQIYPFTKGIGLAAPQIGVPRSMAVVVPSDPPAIVLTNPRVTWASKETDEQFEGCLSFFDVRGQVRRPLSIDVEVADFDGSIALRRFERGIARLVLHEIDHLRGRLYVERLTPGANLISMEDYRGTSAAWQY
ncbi:MAG: peptide deformylase [Actinomycetota bacterium]|nr:peptide deformylase [Actinomycetota bacterium]